MNLGRVKLREPGSRLREGSEFKSPIKADTVCDVVVLSNTGITEITPDDLTDLTNTSHKD